MQAANELKHQPHETHKFKKKTVNKVIRVNKKLSENNNCQKYSTEWFVKLQKVFNLM
jgi:hypothetical protein